MDNPYASPSSNPAARDSYTSVGSVSPRIIDIMRRTRGWVRLVAVLLFISSALQVVSVVMALVGPGAKDAAFKIGEIAGGIIGFVLYFIPAMKLNGYANNIARFQQSGSSQDLEAALCEHRRYWKFWGILMVILIVFMVIGVLLAVVGGVA